MKIQFIGTGGAFDVAFGNSAAIVEHDGLRVLLDCGHSVFPELVRKGLVDTLDAVLLTHLHDDHAGSLSTLIFYYNLVLKKGKLQLIVPSCSFQAELEEYLTHSLRKPQERMQFVDIGNYPFIEPIDTFGHHVDGMQTWAYVFKSLRSCFVYSGDNGRPDLLFEKIRLMGHTGATVFHDICFTAGVSAHAYYKDLMGFQQDFKIWGYHCDAHLNPDDNTIPLVFHQPSFVG